MKNILLFIFIFMITGCTVNYELEIKEDLSLIEQITILNNESYFDKEGEVQSRYKYLVDLGMKENNYFSYNYLEKNNLYGGLATKNYKTLELFKEEASSYKKMYDDININYNGSIVTLNSVGKLKIERIVFINDQSMDQSIPENTYFSIKVPFEVLEHNADRVDTDYNIFYWDITTSTTDNKSMMISFDTNKRHSSIVKFLKEFNYTIPSIIVIIIIGIVFINNIIKKNEKNNRI